MDNTQKSTILRIRISDDPCVCCGGEVDRADTWKDFDPWEHRMDDYCECCSWNRCDAYPGECGVL